jgi:trigger factor
MQVSVENAGGLERRLTVHVPGDEIQGRVDSKLKELSKEVRIKGFRPGRVPMSVVRQRYGKQVRLDIVNETMQQSLQQAFRDEDLRPASPPRVDASPKSLEGGDLEFTAVIEVYPEIGAIDVAGLSIARPDAEVTETDVDDMLETLREQRKTWEEVDRKAESGDRVVIEYAAESEAGRVPAEGEQRSALVLGDSGFEELEKAVARLAPGEQKKVKLEFPENFREPALAGSEAETELKLVSVAVGKLPEVDQEFIMSFGVEDGTLEALRQEIRGNLERELRQATSSVLKAALIEELLNARPDLEVPEGMVSDEATAMAAQATQSQDGMPDAQVVQAFMDPARRRVRAGLLLGELAQQNQIRTDAGKVREAIETIAGTYEQPAEVMQLYYGNPQLMQQVESSVLEGQVVDWVLENAKVTPKAMTFKDVIAGATQSPQGG